MKGSMLLSLLVLLSAAPHDVEGLWPFSSKVTVKPELFSAPELPHNITEIIGNVRMFLDNVNIVVKAMTQLHEAEKQEMQIKIDYAEGRMSLWLDQYSDMEMRRDECLGDLEVSRLNAAS